MTAISLGLAISITGLTAPALPQAQMLDQSDKVSPAETVYVPPPAPVVRPRPTSPVEPRRPRPTDQGLSEPLPPISFGQTINENATSDGRCQLDAGARFYQFNAQPNTRIEITLRSQAFDPVLDIGRVNGCEFESIARNDDGAGVNDGTNSRLTGTLTEGGNYVIRASAYGSSGIRGSYRLALQQLPAAAPRATSTRPIALTVGRSVHGSLDSSDPAIETTQGSNRGFIERSASRPYHLYSLSGRAGQSYEVRLDSGDFDSFLESGAMTPMGFAVLDSNDDGPGSGRNSRLTVTFPVSGTIMLRVSPLNRGSGRYTVSAVQAGSE